MRLMTSKDNDWIDDVLEDEPCNGWQMGIIEGLLNTSSSRDSYTNININELTYAEADEIIRELRENDNPRDPRDQFYKIFGRHKG
jgi:hypothetical protein